MRRLRVLDSRAAGRSARVRLSSEVPSNVEKIRDHQVHRDPPVTVKHARQGWDMRISCGVERYELTVHDESREKVRELGQHLRQVPNRAGSGPLARRRSRRGLGKPACLTSNDQPSPVGISPEPESIREIRSGIVGLYAALQILRS